MLPERAQKEILRHVSLRSYNHPCMFKALLTKKKLYRNKPESTVLGHSPVCNSCSFCGYPVNDPLQRELCWQLLPRVCHEHCSGAMVSPHSSTAARWLIVIAVGHNFYCVRPIIEQSDFCLKGRTHTMIHLNENRGSINLKTYLFTYLLVKKIPITVWR